MGGRRCGLRVGELGLKVQQKRAYFLASISRTTLGVDLQTIEWVVDAAEEHLQAQLSFPGCKAERVRGLLPA